MQSSQRCMCVFVDLYFMYTLHKSAYYMYVQKKNAAQINNYRLHEKKNMYLNLVEYFNSSSHQ